MSTTPDDADSSPDVRWPIRPDRPLTRLEEAAWEFHERNRNIWILFLRDTFDRIDKGFRHYSADAVMHQIRWKTDEGDNRGSGSGFKISNNHVTYYGRWFNSLYPEYGRFFRTQLDEDGERDQGDEDGEWKLGA